MPLLKGMSSSLTTIFFHELHENGACASSLHRKQVVAMHSMLLHLMSSLPLVMLFDLHFGHLI
jgi:hypothetical protein